MKVITPLDGSPLSESALPYAHALAERWQSSLLLLHVTEPFIPIGLGGQPELAVQVQDESMAASREYLEDVKVRFPRSNTEVSAVLGYPREEISQIATSEQAEVIVMASHGRSGPARWLLGSVAEAVLRLAPCPVLLVRGSVSPKSYFSNVLVPIDGSPLSQAVLSKIPPYLGPESQVTLVRATEMSFQDRGQIIDTQALAGYLEGLEQQLKLVKVDGQPLNYKVVDGDAAGSITDLAKELGCDLIAMASHGRSGFRRLWLGSVTEKVARQAPCPVLVLPSSAL